CIVCETGRRCSQRALFMPSYFFLLSLVPPSSTVQCSCLVTMKRLPLQPCRHKPCWAHRRRSWDTTSQDSSFSSSKPCPCRDRLCCDMDPHHGRTLGCVGANGLGAGRTYGADELPGAIAGRDHPVLWNRTRTRRSSISTPAYHACPRCLRCPSVDKRRMAAAPPLWSSRVPPALLHVLEPTRAHQVHNVRAALELIKETTKIQG